MNAMIAAATAAFLALEAPVGNWYDALPLGNGGAGALVWGGGDTLNITLDRADFWHNVQMPAYLAPDFTWATLVETVEKKDDARRRRAIDGEPDKSATKLPGVRLIVKFARGCTIKRFKLAFENGLAEVEMDTPAGGRTVLAWFEDGDDLLSLHIPDDAKAASMEFLDNPSFGRLGGYPESETWRGPDAFVYSRRRRDGADNRFDRDFRAGVRFRPGDSAPGPASRGTSGARSRVSIPDPDMQRLYDLAIYLYGAGARRGNPPIALQGLWTADNGGLPPWHGDYHNDLNTEMTYWAAGPAGCIEALEAFADFYIERLPECREFCRKIFQLPEGAPPAAAIPPTMGYAAQPISGWTAYTMPPVHGIWVFDTMCDAWLYDPTREKAARYLAFGRELAAGLEYAMKNDRGVRRFDISCSPEINDNRVESFLDANSSYERAILESFYRFLSSLSAACGDGEEAAKWLSYSGSFGPPNVTKDGVLKISNAIELKESHRHPSHLLQIFPLVNMFPEKGVDALGSVEWWEGRGTGLWCGYSFSWAGCFEARLGRGDKAWRYLKDFQRAFVSRSGLHLNGDQLKCGLSRFTYKPFTLEGNFGYARGIQEMLVSAEWAGGSPGAVRVKLFPALPAEWNGKEVSFENLFVPGGYRISAKRDAQGKVSWKGTARDGSPVASLERLEIKSL